MIRISILLYVTFFCYSLNAQLNISEVSNFQYSKNLSDVWGWDDGSGKEYALVGVYDGFSVVDISDASNPVEVFWESGNSSIWRDIKTWNNYAYVTTEGGGGLLIVDLASLPEDTNLVYYEGLNYPFQSAHNLYIDENGIAYIFGADFSEGGAIMLDLNQNPLAPIEIGIFDDYYVHDGVVRGDTLWASCINDGIQVVVDVSDKSNTVLMGSWSTPSDFAHNCWFSDDGKYLFTTDEKEFAYIASYDVSNLSNVVELDRWQSNPGTGTIPHNTHYINGYLVTSYYNDGITINDVSNPARIVEVGNFDTSPQFSGNDAGGFHGSWGAYPWLPSGLILAADIENGLFVLEPNYKRASYLEGVVYEEGTSNLISNAGIEILGYGVLTFSDNNGNYSTGVPEEGSVSVVYSAPGFYNDTVNLNIVSGDVTIYEALLKPRPILNLKGKVKNGSWENVPNSSVLIYNEYFDYAISTNVAGDFEVNNLYLDHYNIVAGAWGYTTTEELDRNIITDDEILLAFVEDGYYDDFTFDFGWMIEGSASAGIWERGVPKGTEYNGIVANPDKDIDGDLKNLAYITGNNGSNGGDDDIDDGLTRLTSPTLNLSDYSDPYIRFDTWFFNGGGFGSAPNDSLNVYLISGGEKVLILSQTVEDEKSKWISHNIRVTDYITPSSSMNLVVEAMDHPEGHIVEAGFDGFRVVDGPNSIDENEFGQNFLYPNPFNNQLTIDFGQEVEIQVIILDMLGKVIVNRILDNGKGQIDMLVNKGVYVANIYKQNQLVQTQKLIKY